MYFFLILNPYNFVPLAAHIKLEINHSNELEHSYGQEVCLMVFNDKLTIQAINLNKKTFHMILNKKDLKFWNVECADHPSKNKFKIF